MDSQLLHQAHQPYSINIKTSLKYAWEAFLQDPWMYILYTLIGIGINLIIYNIPFINGFIMVILGLPLQLGIAIYFYKKNQTRQVVFKDFFNGFQRTKELLKFFLYAILASIIVMIPLFIAIVLVEVGNDVTTGVTNTSYSIFTKIVIALYSPIVLFLSISIIFAPYFIYFFNKSAIESMRLSFEFVKPKWFRFFIFYLMIFLIGFAGMLPFFLGLLIATPVTSLATFHLFAKSTGMPLKAIEAKEMKGMVNLV